MFANAGWALGAYALVWLIGLAVIALVLYFVLRKAVAHGIRDAQRAAAREERSAPPTDRT